MNVRLIPHRPPGCSILYSSVVHLWSDGTYLYLEQDVTQTDPRDFTPRLRLHEIARLELDEDGGAL